MAHPNSLANLKSWQKGESGNPRGGMSVRAEIKALQTEAKVEVMEVISKTLLMTPAQLKASLEDPSVTMAQHLVASVLSKAIKQGCPMRAQFLMNYVLGRPKTFDPLEDHDPDQPTAGKVLKGVPSSILLEMVKSAQGPATAE